MELSQSDERFLVPDSEDEELSNCEAWDLILGLKALADARRQLYRKQKVTMDEDQEKSAEKKQSSIFPPIESEDSNSEPQVALVYDTISDSGSGSSREKHNVTVIDRGPPSRDCGIKKEIREGFSTPSEYIGSLQLSQQAMLVPETMESLSDGGPSPHMSLTGPFIVPDSPSQDYEESTSGFKDKNIEADDEVTFNPRLLSALSGEDGQGESQGLQLRLSPSQVDSTQNSGTPDQIAQVPMTSGIEPLSTTPVKNSKASLSCRKLSLKGPSPAKHHVDPVPRPFEKPSMNMFLDEEDVGMFQEEDQEETLMSKGGYQGNRSRSAQSLGLFLDTEEDLAWKPISRNQHTSESLKEADEKDKAEGVPSWSKERNSRRQRRQERLQKIIDCRIPDSEGEGKKTSALQKDDGQKSVENAASLVFTEEQDSVKIDDEQTMSYNYNHSPDQNIDLIQSSRTLGEGQGESQRQSPSQSQGEFHGFEREDEMQGASGELENTHASRKLMETVKPKENEDQPEVSLARELQTGISSLDNGSVEDAKVPQFTPEVSVRRSEGSTLQDPYTFYGSQSQNMADVSAQPLTDKPKKTKKIKEMRKVLKKKIPAKQNVATSSTDDADVAKHALSASERRRQKVATKQTKKQKAMAKTEKTSIDAVEAAGIERPSSRLVGLMLPPITESTVKMPLGQETQSLNVSKVAQAEIKLSRKGTTVSFSDEPKSRGGVSVPETSDRVQWEREKKTVKEVMAMVVSRETLTEVFDSRGQLLRQTTTSEVIHRTVLEPPWPSPEVHVSEQIISPGTSPTRSISTLASGDLADVSSSSLSRTLSSGSKGSNPSLEAAIQSYPTPAQRTRSMDHVDTPGQDEEYNAINAAKPGVSTTGTGKVDAKRLSSGSNTGQDLFETPNESMIAKCDSSHTGTVVTSSHNTPVTVLEPQAHCSHQTPPTTTALSVAGNQIVQSGGITEDTISSRGNVVALKDRGKRSVSPRTPVKTQRAGFARISSTDAHREHKEMIKKKKGKEDDSMEEEVELVGKGKRRTGDLSTSGSFKGKGKRLAEESDNALEKEASSKKRLRSDQGLSEMEGVREGSEERGGSGVSTGFVIQGVGTASPVVKGNSQATSSRLHSAGQEELMTILPLNAPLNIKSKLEIGEQVMGKWKDGCFYPGVLNKMELHTQKFQVKFDDGTQRWVDAHGLLLAKELPVGQSVMVLSVDGFYVCGMIMKHSTESHKESGKVVIYHVERDDGVNQKCERSSLLLTEDQAVCLLSDDNLSLSSLLIKSPYKVGDVSLDNLVEGKRKPKLSKDRASTSSVQEKTCDTSTTEENADELPSGRRRMQGPVATSTPTPKQASRVPKSLTGSTGKLPKTNPLGGVMSSPVAPRKSSRVCLDLSKGSVKPKPDLLKGKAFLVTHINKTAQQRAEEKRLLQDSSLDTSADDNAEEETEYHPFVKDQLCTLIKGGGGIILDSFDEEEIEKIGKSNCYIIASEHHRTIKYLQGLASGFILVSHEWILHSVAQNRLLGLKAFMLPSGISLEKKRLMEWKGSCTELDGQTIMVLSKREEFIEVWSSILKTASCHLVGKFPPRASKIDPGVDFVVTDDTCLASVVRKCNSLEVPVVSSEWVAQCLINNRLVDPNAHEQYKHDYSS